jgi:hypothetical protein
MGTMIQRRQHGLDEADYRGAMRFADWPSDVPKGNNDLLSLTRPDVIARFHAPTWTPAPTSSRPTPSTAPPSPGRLRPGGPGLRAQRRSGATGPRSADAVTAAETPSGRASSPACSARPTARRRSRRTSTIRATRNVDFDDLRVPTPSHARPDRRRRRPPAGRDGLRHAERQGGDLRHRARCSTERRRPAADDLRHHHRPVRPHALRPDARGVLELRRATPAPGQSASTARSAPRSCAPSWRNCPHRRHAGLRLSERRPAERARRATTRRPERWPRIRRLRRAGWSTSSAAAAAPRRSTSARSPRPSRHAPRAMPRSASPAAPLGLEPFEITQRQPVRQRRRAHQRHRLGALQAADQGRRLRRRWRSPASRSRTAPRSSTSTWTRACSTPRRRWSPSST